MTRWKRYALLLLSVNFLVSLLATAFFFYGSLWLNSQQEYYDPKTGEIYLWNCLRYISISMLMLFVMLLVMEIAVAIVFKIASYLFGKKPQ